MMEDLSTIKILSDLFKGLELDEDPCNYSEILTTNTQSYSPVSKEALISLKETIASRCPDQEAFLEKLEELQQQNAEDLTPLLVLISKIQENPQVTEFLHQNAVRTSSFTKSHGDDGSVLSAGSSRYLSNEDKNVLRLNIKKALASSSNKCIPKGDCVLMAPMNMINYPCQPDWIAERPFLTLKFKDENSPTLKSMDGVSLHQQEELLLRDLINCMSGVGGDYISLNLSNYNVAVCESVDPSLRDMVLQNSAVISHYAVISQFVDEHLKYDKGQVANALAAAINVLLKDYLISVAQLETELLKGKLTFQKLFYYSQPMLLTMEQLSAIASIVTSLETKSFSKSGRILSFLHDRACGLVNESDAKLFLYLIQSASVPYFQILERWICKGVIFDPYLEFMLVDNEKQITADNKDDYWEKRFSLNISNTPIFLEKFSDKLLKTGKYLNVIRQCGKQIKTVEIDKLKYSLNQEDYISAIESSYLYASKTLMELLMNEMDLMKRLQSVKHYFLMDQGDFVIQFMDLCEVELQKPSNTILLSRITSLLELALHSSAAKCDPYNEDVSIVILKFNLMQQMFNIVYIEAEQEYKYRSKARKTNLTGLESFAFNYKVQWPISLILNEKAIGCYQMMFRHLFYCKHIERVLSSVWISCKKLDDTGFVLLQQMMNFVQNLEYYMTSEVIEPYWVKFQSQMSKVTNIDDVLACHTDFINLCMDDCMLTCPQLLNIVTKLLKMCEMHAKYLQTIIDNEHFDNIDVQSRITDCDSKFTEMVLRLLGLITEKHRDNSGQKLINILHRLDFNSFYTKRNESMGKNSLTQWTKEGSILSLSSVSTHVK